MLALFKYGPLGALAVIIIIFAVDALTENVLFPSMMGKGLQLSPAFFYLLLFSTGISYLDLEVCCFPYLLH